MDLSMQMKALRSLNLAKLSSKSSTRDEYWVTSISAGTPAGYCLSQMRSMGSPPLGLFPLNKPATSSGLVVWVVELSAVLALWQPMASGGTPVRHRSRERAGWNERRKG